MVEHSSLGQARWTFTLALTALLSACGGGGGGGSPVIPAPGPSVSLSATPTSVSPNATVTLTWSSLNAVACTASGGWTGSKATSGTEASTALTATTTFTLTCNNGSGTTATQSTTVTVNQPPTATLNANPVIVPAAGATTLTWSSTNATSCTASGGWTGNRAATGTEEIRPLVATTTFNLTCTGAGGTTAPQSVQVTVSPVAAGSAIVSGKIQFERIPFEPILGNGQGNGLDPTHPVSSPARDVVVEAIQGATILATTTTNATGDYAFTVPANSTVFIRAKAQMLKTTNPSWNFQVLNNTNGNALYALDDNPASVGTGATRDLTARTGWGTTSYTGTRAAAPFAILDTVYRAKELVRTATNLDFPPLRLFWSTDNRPANDPLCPEQGNIGTTSYVTGGGLDECPPPKQKSPILEGIYILGNVDPGDTDEFDQHVIAHEFGHYIDTQFSRSDSLGGSHGVGDKLDLRIAWGEGWGNAFSAMALNDPVYRDSHAVADAEFNFDMEDDDTRFNDGGWFSETSVQEILWDIFDTTNESGDTVSLGFAPIFAVMRDEQLGTDAFASIFSFMAALRDNAPGSASAIDQLRNGEQISGTTDFATGETNSGSDPNALPIYRSISAGQQLLTCVNSINGVGQPISQSPLRFENNKLGNHRFFRLDLANAAVVTFRAIGAVDPNNTASQAAVDPDIYVYRRGSGVAAGFQETTPTQTVTSALTAGTYIIDVLDAELPTQRTTRCMTLSLQSS